MLPDGFIENLPSSWESLVSLAFIGFVAILLLTKLYVKIRSRFKVHVNCWFCNRNTRVLYKDYNSWDCPHCSQYNGFTNDGDYNREIVSQHSASYVQFNRTENGKDICRNANGFCQPCNDNQLTKVQKLAAFEPYEERTFALELKKFRETLEDTYRLCPRCEKKLNRVLVEKKKMVLGLRLAEKGLLPRLTKKFMKPLHMQTSISVKTIRKIINISLFLLALFNWINITCDWKLKRENLVHVFGEIVAPILFIIISHLAAFTKVMIKYFSAILQVHLIEQTISYIRTVSFLVAYAGGFNVHKQLLAFKDVFSQSAIPFGSMFLAFGAHMIDGFRVTKNTYLLALWSAYSYLSLGEFPEEYDVYRITTAFILLVFSLPSFNRKNELHDILNNSVSSFHRIHSDDCLTENASNVENRSKSINNSLNISKSSNSSCSLSPISISSRGKTLTSSTLDLCATPTSAFKTYSNEFLNNTRNSCVNNSFTFNPVPKSFSTNTINNSFSQTPLRVTRPLHVDANLNTSFGGCATPKSFVSCATSFTTRRNLLSPSHFAAMNNSVCCNAYASPAQSPCPSNIEFYNNFDDKLEKQKKYIFSHVIPHESVSRGSSQSSGFESISGSLLQPVNEKFYTSECPVERADDLLTACPEQLHTYDYSAMMHNRPIQVPSQPPFAGRNNIFQSKVMDFETGDHWIRNTSNHQRQVFNADLWPQPTNSNIRISSAFDLNGMNSYLPPVRKRYKLLGSLNEHADKDTSTGPGS